MVMLTVLIINLHVIALFFLGLHYNYRCVFVVMFTYGFLATLTIVIRLGLAVSLLGTVNDLGYTR